MNVLGFSSDLIPRWLDKSTGKRYPTSIVDFIKVKNLAKLSKVSTTTLNSAFYERGVEFAPGVPAGVEIEDAGGSRTAGSHPEAGTQAK
jgi:hypothetical protein